MNDASQQYDIDVEDVEYLRHGGKPLLARVYRPRGKGPFPLIVDVHGGAWCRKDRTTDVATDEALARSGVVAVALDFRMPPEAKYPASVMDINYGVRWCKANAEKLGSRSDRVGLLGVSSGGHQSLLVAMRPHDKRYSSIPLDSGSQFDASVPCLVLCWPVFDPLRRYAHAQQLKRDGNKFGAQWVDAHNAFWAGEAEMAEGNPKLALDRGERVSLPPILYLQGTADIAHPVDSREQFIASYRKAGGRIELHLFDGVGEAFITSDPSLPQSVSALAKIVEFVHREL
ncbi:MAG TPA: alpha/beta hydrolase [Burkholderiales bacterium]|nr:alpha/beta hydrolase [Burkholderiales bacterium]